MGAGELGVGVGGGWHEEAADKTQALHSQKQLTGDEMGSTIKCRVSCHLV